HKKSIWPFAFKKLKGTGPLFALMVITTALVSAFGLISPGFSRFFTDFLLTDLSPGLFLPFLVLISIFTIFQIATLIFQAIYTLRINGQIALTSSYSFMWHLLRLPVEFYGQRIVGDIIARKDENTSVVNVLVTTLAPLVIDCIMLVFYLVILLRYSVLLSIVGIVSVLLDLLITNAIAKKQTDLARVNARDKARQISSGLTAISSIESIKASGSENGFFERWAGNQATANNSAVAMDNLSLNAGLFPTIISAVANVLILGGGVCLCVTGHWTVGMITAFMAFLNSFLTPASKIVSLSQTMQTMRTQMERVEDVMEYPVDVNFAEDEDLDNKEFDKLTGKVKVENISFGYCPLEEALIQDFSLEVEPGKSVALVGSSGCGKSTIAKLIAGLIDPWKGKILLDGKTKAEIDPYVFSSSITMVEQESALFADSFRNNIKLWDETIEDFEMIMAAKDAKIHDLIASRQRGYNAMLTEDGSNISGGQRQRVEIARVLAEDPRMIILDEATSALDAKTEHEVVRAIEARGVSLIVVAHRLSTIRNCDEIIVLDKGKIVDRGKHDYLYKNCKLYKNLVMDS
ncbi:MAG: ATP-binding cassette domain-containing protein, partial [Streptococcus gallolyticus]|nr:ATP-binding cassette domain-containing protein [Streptococcus gallolyticus]